LYTVLHGFLIVAYGVALSVFIIIEFLRCYYFKSSQISRQVTSYFYLFVDKR
jgi:hypothetical protein